MSDATRSMDELCDIDPVAAFGAAKFVDLINYSTKGRVVPSCLENAWK